MGCQKFAYNLYKPAMWCVYNAAGGKESRFINTNARFYDPVIGRFLSPDPYVQDPYFSQSYNRYAYVRNNPLLYRDPTGMQTTEGDEDEDDRIPIRGVDTWWIRVFRHPHIAAIWFGSGTNLPGSPGGPDVPGGNNNPYGGVGGGSNTNGSGDSQQPKPPLKPNPNLDEISNIVSAIDVNINMVIDATPNPTKIMKISSAKLSLIGVVLDGVNAYLQYTRDGRIQSLTATGLGAGLAGLLSKAAAKYSIGGSVTPFIGSVAGWIGEGLFIFGSWMMIYQPAIDLQNAPLYIDQNGVPHYGEDYFNPYNPYDSFY